MPLYEYQCAKCRHRFERIEKMEGPRAKKCPKCGAKVEQLLAAPAIQFKGSGWYVSDYGRKGAAPSDSGDGASSKTEKSDTKDAKPAKDTKDSASPKESKKATKEK